MKKRVLAALLVTMMTVGTVADVEAVRNLMIQIRRQLQMQKVMIKKILERK